MKTYPLLPVALLMFANILGFSILIPILPFIVKSYGAGEITYGILLSSFFVFQLLGAPVLGSLSDKYGRKPILMASHFGTLMSWVIFGVAWFLPNIPVFGFSLPLLVIGLSRIVDGITGGNVSVAHAYLADITEPRERTRSYGMMGAVIGFGLIVGPALGSFSGSTPIGYLGMVIAAFCISLVTLTMMGLYLSESLALENRTQHSEVNFFGQFNLLKKILQYRKNHLIMRILVLRVFFSLAMTSYTAIIIFYLIDRFHFDQVKIGFFALAIGVFLIFNQMVLVRQFVRRWGDIGTLVSGQAFMMLGLFFLPNANEIAVFIIIYYFINLGISLSMPSIKGVLTKSVSPSKQGEINGIDEGINSLAAAFGPTFAGVMYALFDAEVFRILSLLIFIPLSFFFIREIGFKDAVFFDSKK